MQRAKAVRAVPAPRHAIPPAEQIERAPQSPRLNRLLAALPEQDYERFLLELEPVSLPRGLALHRAGDLEKYLYFMTSGVVARYYVAENGASNTYAVTGNEGVVGIAAFLGGNGAPSHARLIFPGHAYRIGAGRLQADFENVGALATLMLRYTQALIAQITQSAACNRHHSIQQQLCRWMLSCLDRMPSNSLVISQEDVANMLGVRREGITEAAGHLRTAGVIECSRGRIKVLDREALQARVCECYGVVRSEIDRLVPTRARAALA